ncbi:MAG: hypothetical protein ACOH2D_08840 [Gelidibacter sp.]
MSILYELSAGFAILGVTVFRASLPFILSVVVGVFHQQTLSGANIF